MSLKDRTREREHCKREKKNGKKISIPILRLTVLRRGSSSPRRTGPAPPRPRSPRAPAAARSRTAATARRTGRWLTRGPPRAAAATSGAHGGGCCRRVLGPAPEGVVRRPPAAPGPACSCRRGHGGRQGRPSWTTCCCEQQGPETGAGERGRERALSSFFFNGNDVRSEKKERDEVRDDLRLLVIFRFSFFFFLRSLALFFYLAPWTRPTMPSCSARA